MMKMMMIVALTILVILSHRYHSFICRTSVSLHHQHHYHNHKNHYKKMIRLYNSNIYLSDGLPLINDINVINVATNKEENFLSYINSKNNNNDDNNDNQNTLIILGTYAADFNTIEYIQKLLYYLPSLKKKKINRFYIVLNASVQACEAIKRIFNIPDDVEILSDSNGFVGQSFNVNRGWIANDRNINPFVKLFGMLLGLGASMTLPSVISGYLGNPWKSNGWIEASLAANQINGLWPDNALIINNDSKQVEKNSFDDLPLVGTWKTRPLELATLRLQNMLGISLKYWEELKPTEIELERGLLTQLGGVIVFNPQNKIQYKWLDDGICHNIHEA